MGLKLYTPDLQCNADGRIWIRFTLSVENPVEFQIYAVGGTLVRTLECGTLAMGDYTSRQKAVLWDRKNESAEVVLSGIYTLYGYEDGVLSGQGAMLLNSSS